MRGTYDKTRCRQLHRGLDLPVLRLVGPVWGPVITESLLQRQESRPEHHGAGTTSFP